jgi:CBS domain-containing protein
MRHHPAMASRRVSELMNPDVVCARPGMTVTEAAKLLAKRGVSGAPVVDDDGRILGVVSQNDLVRATAREVTQAEAGRFFTDVEEYSEMARIPVDLSETPVEEVMTRKVHSVGRETGVAIAANIMREHRIHRLLITERGRLVGVVTSLDLLRIVEEAC